MDKATTYTIDLYAYSYDKNGQRGTPCTYRVLQNSICLRDFSGRLQVAEPSGDNDAANKNYVDNNDYHIFGLPFYNTEYRLEEFTESMDKFLN